MKVTTTICWYHDISNSNAVITSIYWSSSCCNYRSVESNTQSMILSCKAPVELFLWNCLNKRICQKLQSKQQLRLVIHGKGRKILKICHNNSSHISTYTNCQAVQGLMELFQSDGWSLHWTVANEISNQFLMGLYGWKYSHSNPSRSGWSVALILMVMS